MRIFLTTKIWKEGNHYIAYTPELEVASQGKNPEHAERRLREAIALFLEEVKRMGMLQEALRGVGFVLRNRKWETPRVSISALEVAV